MAFAQIIPFKPSADYSLLHRGKLKIEFFVTPDGRLVQMRENKIYECRACRAVFKNTLGNRLLPEP